MIIWGAMWGAVLSVLVSRWDDWELVIGSMLGALAGWTLRQAVRNEVKRLAVAKPQAFGEQKALTAEHDTTVVLDQSGGTKTSTATSNSAVSQIADVSQELTVRNAKTPLTEEASTYTSPAALQALENAATPSTVAKPVEVNLMMTLVGSVKNWLLGGNTVARVGAAVLFIGLSFLAKWAADNALFPPEARLTAIGLVGIALLVQGFRFARSNASGAARANYGLLLQGAGVAALYLVVFAAYKLYALISPLSAFTLMALVCALSTLLAVLLGTQTLALVGFAGAFATPILLSTGVGGHVPLYGYYLLLNIAIGIVVWLRAWRALNLLGFLSTFIVASFWGVLNYVPEHYASVQPFLVAFFALYVAIGLVYALRHSSAKGHALDGMLIFGTPIIAFTLQTQLISHIEYGAAISSVVLSFFYIALASALRSKIHPLARWLMLSYAALSLIFATLAIPLAMDGKLTAAIWAIEGAGVFWLAAKQRRWVGQAFGAAMQLLAATAFVVAFGQPAASENAFANSFFVGTLMLSGSSLALSWWAYLSTRDQHQAVLSVGGDDKPRNTTLLDACSVLFFLTGFAWALFGVWNELLSSRLALNDVTRFGWLTFSFIVLVFGAFLAWRRTGWSSARMPVLVVLPFLITCAVLHFVFNQSASLYFDLLLWPACFALHLVMLHGVDTLSPQRWWRIVHVGNTLLLTVLIGGFLYHAVDVAGLRNTDWSAVTLLLASTLVMMALCSPGVWAKQAKRWPLERFQREYAERAGACVALITVFGALVVACSGSGNTLPLPYLPLLSPVDLTALLAIASIALWLKRVRMSQLVSQDSLLRGGVTSGVIGFAAFIVVNTIWLRFAHHFQGIPWSSSALANSFFVQAGYSLLWTLFGVSAMVWAHRKLRRVVWQAGAGLLALTVVKLLAVDLGNSDGGERIVAFISVGVLMVVVGYFAPMPPALPSAVKTKDLEAVNESV